MLECGDKIGDYTLARFLGRGQFGEVWLAEKELQFSTRKVQHALKVLFNLGEEVNLKSAEAEIDTWIEASGHPNVMSVLDMLVHNDHVIIASEYAEGGSLKNWLRRFGGKAPSYEKGLEMMAGILSGIEHLHSRNVVHRDLKPDNILLQGNFPRITDFGISRIISAGSMSTVAMGSPFYMSPESFDGSKSTQTDIWSAGVILYEMLTGNHPYRSDTIYGLVSSIRQNEPVPLPNNMPKELRQIVQTALQKELSKRFPTAKAMRLAIEQEIHNLKVRANSRPDNTVNTNIDTRESIDSSSSATLESADTPPDKNPNKTHETNVRDTVGKKPVSQVMPAGPISAMERSEETLPPLEWSRRTLTAQVEKVNVPTGAESASKVQIKRPDEPLNVPTFMYADRGFGNSQSTPRDRLFLWIAAAVGAMGFGLAIVIFVIFGVTKTLFWSPSNANLDTVASADKSPNGAIDPKPNGMNKMVLIPGGDFVMGRNDGRREEGPMHLVTVEPFYMDSWEVTNEEYAAFVSSGHRNPPQWSHSKYVNGYPPGKENYPAVGIEWNDANEYAHWKGKRLPTEAEWEFAARGDDNRLYPWGNDWDPKNANVESKEFKPVGSYPCNSPFKVCDLIGNAWEWTASDFLLYSNNNSNRKSNQKVIRGGSYEADKDTGTSTYRVGRPMSGAKTYSQTGFRCVRDLEK